MSNSRITCAYSVTAVGVRAASSFAAAMALVPVDLTLPKLYGLLPISDATTTVGAVVTRTMAFSMVPAVAASATARLVPGDGSGSPLTAVVLNEGGGGSGYARAPLPTFTPTSGSPDRPATARCRMKANTVAVLQPGAGFAGTINATFVDGELWPGGTQATGTVTLAGDGIGGIALATAGGPYGSYPDIVLSAEVGGTLGTGAILVTDLTASEVDLLDPGVGYVPGTEGAAPGVVFSPVFKQFFPDSAANQASSLAEFMRARFQYYLQTPVLAEVPVIS